MNVGIESFVSPAEVVRDRMAFKEAYIEGTGRSITDFPVGLTMYHWYVAHMGWTLMRAVPPCADDEFRNSLGVPDDVKPMADLNANYGFYVMVGTVAQVLTLSGLEAAAVEFVARTHALEYDTGQLFMLAYDYVHSVSKLDDPAQPNLFNTEEDTRG